VWKLGLKPTLLGDTRKRLFTVTESAMQSRARSFSRRIAVGSAAAAAEEEEEVGPAASVVPATVGAENGCVPVS